MIDQIRINNYKSIHDVDLKLMPINILIGANGAGKSNFISFFKLLKNLYEQNLQNFIASELGAENILYFGLKNSGYLYAWISFEPNSYSFKLIPDMEGGLFFESENTGYKGDGDSSPNISPIGNGHKESLLKKSDTKISTYVKEHIDSFRIFHFHDTSSTSKIRLAGNIFDNEFLREDGRNLASFLYRLQETSPKTVRKIEMQIKSLLPFLNVSI